MNGIRKLHSTPGGLGSSLVRCGLSVLTLAALAGCSDHRISLAEFLDIQQEVAQEAASTQPAVVPDEARALMDSALGPYQVGQGDVLRVTLSRLEEGFVFPILEVRVDNQGQVDLPGAGLVTVSDMTLEDAEDAILGAYVPRVYREAVVHAALVEPETTNVLVTGAVTLPGLVRLRRTERNLLYAIAAAGGVADIASGWVNLRRIREPGAESMFQLTDPAGMKDALAQAPLESGDIVKVRAAIPNTIFVGGLVAAPRPQVYPQDVEMTILQAIAAAGGLRTDVFPKEGTLIRRMPDGRDLHVKLDLDRLANGKDPNIALAAGDVLWVPHTVETRVQDWINKNIFFRAGVTATAGANYNATAIEFMNSNAKATQLRDTGTLQDQFDPFGFLQQNQALQTIPTGP